jgi:penicillin-binding protein 1C
LIEDRPVSYGIYTPKDFDIGFKGTVSVREALQFSLNVPAVAVLDRVGPSRLAARLSQAGATLTLPDNAVPGLAIGLGGVGIKLSDLTMLYAGIARLGAVLPIDERIDASPPQARRLMDPVAAWYVGNVLLGSPPPDNGVAGRIAFKTGTSWVGRPDGAPVPGLVGRSAAAPILFDAFARLGGPPAPLPRPPAGVLTASNTRLPPPLRRFQPGRLAGETARSALRILFPPNGAELDVTAQPQPVALRVTGAVAPLTVLVDGLPVTGEGRGSLFFNPRGPGFSRVTVIDAAGSTDSIVVRVGDGSAALLPSGLAP